MYCSNCDNFLKGDEYCEACYRALEAERDELKALADNLECQLVALKAENNSLWAKEIDASGQRDEALKVLKECERYMTERGVSHEYAIMIRLRALLKRHGRDSSR